MPETTVSRAEIIETAQHLALTAETVLSLIERGHGGTARALLQLLRDDAPRLLTMLNDEVPGE